MVLAERCISLTENAVEKRGYDTNTETARSFRDSLEFCVIIWSFACLYAKFASFLFSHNMLLLRKYSENSIMSNINCCVEV